MWAKREDVAQVLDNLIDNALRYSSPGAEVRVETSVRDGGLCLAVADTGPGISPEDRPRVFERFYRGANGRRAGGGTGLGLAIVERARAALGRRSPARGCARAPGWKRCSRCDLSNPNPRLAEPWEGGW